MTVDSAFLHHSQFESSIAIDQRLTVRLRTCSGECHQEELNGPSAFELVIVHVIPRKFEQNLGRQRQVVPTHPHQKHHVNLTKDN